MMQKTEVVYGTVTDEFGRTVAEHINERLEKNPGFKLTQTIVLKCSEVFCTLLCVFENSEETAENKND